MSHVVDLKSSVSKAARGKADQLTSEASLQYLKHHDIPTNMNNVLLKVFAEKPADPLAMIERELREIARLKKQQSIIQHSSAQVFPAPNSSSGPSMAPPKQKKQEPIQAQRNAPAVPATQSHSQPSSVGRKPSVVSIAPPTEPPHDVPPVPAAPIPDATADDVIPDQNGAASSGAVNTLTPTDAAGEVAEPVASRGSDGEGSSTPAPAPLAPQQVEHAEDGAQEQDETTTSAPPPPAVDDNSPSEAEVPAMDIVAAPSES